MEPELAASTFHAGDLALEVADVGVGSRRARVAEMTT